MVIRVLFLFLFLSCSQNHYTWFYGTIDKALSLIDSDSKKLLLLDFYSDDWGGCVRLDTETLTDQRVINFSNSNLISIKLKPWEDEKASNLFDEYKGQAIPLLIFLNSEGLEVDRILGFYPPDEYLEMITDIYEGVGTYLSLKNKYLSGENSSNILSKLSSKCKSNREPEFCENIYSDILSLKNKFEDNIIFQAELFFANKELNKGTIQPMLDLIHKDLNSELVSDAYFSIINYYRSTDQLEKEANIFKKFTDRVNDQPSILNQYAWRMSELGKNLEDALQKSNLAIDLADNPALKSYIIDTKAEILWLMGKSEEAIDAINLAIDIDSKSDYFIEQKNKFQNSIKE